jgi:hypothetical protein
VINKRIHRKEQHLEDRIKGYQPCAVVGVTLGQIIPHDHHRNASGKPDHDEADHVFRAIAQKQNCQSEHQDRPDDPVLHQRQGEDFDVAEHVAQFVVIHLRQRRVHHENQPDRDWYRRGADAHAVKHRLEPGENSAERNPGPHREEDPEGQVSVEKGQPSRRRRVG